MKNTYYHPSSVTTVNGNQLYSNISTIGSQIKAKIYEYFTDSSGAVTFNKSNVNGYKNLVADYANFSALIKSLFLASKIDDPIRSIIGNYYVFDTDLLNNKIIYLFNSNEDPIDKNSYPFPFKDLFSLEITKLESTSKVSKFENVNISINNTTLYNFISKYIFDDIENVYTLSLLTLLFNYVFKDTINKLLQDSGEFYYCKYQQDKHSEKNISSRNGDYLSYNLSSEYNQYIQKYETYFSSSLRRESVIPNYYITDLYLNDQSQKIAEKVVTLNGLVDVTKETVLGDKYYIDLISKLSSLTAEQITSLPNIRNILLDDELTNIENVTLSSENFPYNIDLKFNNYYADGIIQALENHKLNILATNNYLSPATQKTNFNFYVSSDEIIKQPTTDPDAYIDLDGSLYNLIINNKVFNRDIEGVEYDSVLKFEESYSFYPNPNLNLFLTDKTRKIYNSNKSSFSLFEYLKITSALHSSIESSLTLDTILNNNYINCSPIAFQISKKVNNNTIQNIFIPRNSKISDISYIDTQVIYDKIYRYDIDILNLVQQINYSYKSSYTNIEDLINSAIGVEEVNIDYSNVQVPISLTCTTTQNYFFYKNNLFTDNAVVVDDPPTPIDVNIVPYIGSPNRLLFLFNTQDTTIKSAPIIISESDKQYFIKARHKQRPDKKEILFQTVTDISSIQVFKSSTRPKSYRDFSNSLNNIILLNGNTSTSIVETLEQNKKYYYTFRSVDVHGNISNPTDIFEVKIINNDGAIYPIIAPYYFDQNQKINMEKSFKKYLSIDPAIIQQQLTFDESGNSQLGIDNGFWGNTFKIRVISKESGKAFDINLNFTKKIIETI